MELEWPFILDFITVLVFLNPIKNPTPTWTVWVGFHRPITVAPQLQCLKGAGKGGFEPRTSGSLNSNSLTERRNAC